MCSCIQHSCNNATIIIMAEVFYSNLGCKPCKKEVDDCRMIFFIKPDYTCPTNLRSNNCHPFVVLWSLTLLSSHRALARKHGSLVPANRAQHVFTALNEPYYYGQPHSHIPWSGMRLTPSIRNAFLRYTS